MNAHFKSTRSSRFSDVGSAMLTLARNLWLLVILMLLSPLAATAQCLTAWGYTQPITVTNSSGGTLSNFQVKVTLNTQALIGASQMQSTGADIRFTDGSCNNLNYWIENGTINTTSTILWVNVPS